jgi:UDP-N-acetyl-D-mannosaminouronate:lipid I N-acetyl-D-mannosaminouronosyltransferase
MIPIPKSLNGVNIYPFSSVDELLDCAVDSKKILAAVNAEKILHATDETRSIINANIGYADGIGAVMGLKKKGSPGAVKIPGVELWLKIVERCHSSKSFYLVGGRQEVIEKTVEKLRGQFPGINIAGWRNGYFGENEKAELLRDMADKKPDVVFVGMGSPKQEMLMTEMLARHPALYQGLGGSFDVYTGNVKRAPKWWVDHSLEWAYRLLQEPARIKRQIQLVQFLMLLFFNKF